MGTANHRIALTKEDMHKRLLNPLVAMTLEVMDVLR
jgi:hypothetical protein